MSEVGKRLRSAREATGLSVRKFAESFKEDPYALSNIENGTRFPPRRRVEKFAKLLSLTSLQLEALIAVERRGLDPNQMLPEISPAPLKHTEIEVQAEMVLGKFKSGNRNGYEFNGPIPIEEVLKSTDELCLEDLDFQQEASIGPFRGNLCGCFYPENFQNKVRVVLINMGKIGGRRLSPAERRVTIAHEMGHYFLHYGAKKSKQLLFQFSKQPTYCREAEIRPSKFNLKEYQANVFGACLLMPRNQFKNEWADASGDKSRLADHFAVTMAFVALRAKILNL